MPPLPPAPLFSLPLSALRRHGLFLSSYSSCLPFISLSYCSRCTCGCCTHHRHGTSMLLLLHSLIFGQLFPQSKMNFFTCLQHKYPNKIIIIRPLRPFVRDAPPETDLCPAQSIRGHKPSRRPAAPHQPRRPAARTVTESATNLFRGRA